MYIAPSRQWLLLEGSIGGHGRVGYYKLEKEGTLQHQWRTKRTVPPGEGGGGGVTCELVTTGRGGRYLLFVCGG